MTDAFGNGLYLGDIVFVFGSHKPNRLVKPAYVIHFGEKIMYVIWWDSEIPGQYPTLNWVPELIEQKKWDELYERAKKDGVCQAILLNKTSSKNVAKIYGLNK